MTTLSFYPGHGSIGFDVFGSSKLVLLYLARKSSNTKDTTYTKGKWNTIYGSFSFVTFVYFVFEKVFPL